MNAPSYAFQQPYELDYAVDYGRRGPEREPRRRRPSYSRVGSRPAMVSGIHRRRHKRVAW
jgi:hypothetical protein